MYGKTSVQGVLESVREALAGLHGELDARVVSGNFCCMLHTWVEPDDAGGGCGKMRYGTHPAVRALHERESHVCMVEDGQRKLDARCAAIAVGLNHSSGLANGFRSPSFVKRFFSGFPVHPMVYGRGYCYLWTFVDSARSRAARILGPNPLLVDFLRVWLVLGNWSGELGLRLELTGMHTYHVEKAAVQCSAFDAILRLTDAVRVDASARIGMDRDRVYTPGVLEYGGLAGLPVVRLTSYQDDLRVGALRAWFHTRGLQVSETCLQELLVVTRAASFLTVNETFTKRRNKLLAILGDNVIKTVISVRCIAANAVTEDHTSLSSHATNGSMASKLSVSGLRTCCEVAGLSVTSKSNADIFEGIVGVLSLYCGMNLVEQFLRITGFPFPSAAVDCYVEKLNLDSGLTSDQYAKALKLLADGQL